MTSISDDSCPLAHPEIPNAWATASANAIRWRQVFDKELAEARTRTTEEEANDNAQVAAWLDHLARRRQLRVTRTSADDGRIARHMVEIIEENDDGEVVCIECGGYVYMSELRRGAYGGDAWLYKRQDLGQGWLRVSLMITDLCFSIDHPMFKRKDGSSVYLGFNDNDHFYEFMVDIHHDDLRDEYQQIQ